MPSDSVSISNKKRKIEVVHHMKVDDVTASLFQDETYVKRQMRIKSLTDMLDTMTNRLKVPHDDPEYVKVSKKLLEEQHADFLALLASDETPSAVEGSIFETPQE